MRDFWREELDREEAKRRQEQYERFKDNPLMQYSTTQLKEELRRRKREGE